MKWLQGTGILFRVRTIGYSCHTHSASLQKTQAGSERSANEVCPVWPGQPMTAHWRVSDPAARVGTPEEIQRAFRDTFFLLNRRNPSLSLPAPCFG
jgi:hypothetical protein